MALSDEEIQEHAERIADVHLQDFEYANVYEDEDLEDASEEDWRKIHDFIVDELTTITKSEYNEYQIWKANKEE